MRTLLVLALSLLGAAAHAAPLAEDLIDRYYAEWTRVNPGAATALGIHAHDGELADLRAGARAAWDGRLRFWQGAIEGALTQADCDPACRIDARAVLAYIERERFAIERGRVEERYPDVYLTHLTDALFPLIKREFAPASVRAGAVIARLRRVPALLEAARARLRPELVPKVATSIALEELDGTIAFVRGDVPVALAAIPPREQAALRAAIDQAAAALTAYGAWLKGELLPRARGPVALGAELLAAELAADEMITEPLGALLARGEAELHRLQAEFARVAKEVDPSKTPPQVRDELGRDHPATDQVLAEIRVRTEALRRFIVAQHLVTLPSAEPLIVDETPPFLRATTQASLDPPGPYETAGRQAYFHVTLPEATWPAARAESYLAGALNRPLLDVLVSHEAYPGHYLQALWTPRLTRRARRMQGTSSSIEGWAHYCEAMVLEAGYRGLSPRTHLTQIADALLRAARYVVTLRLHTGRMSVEEAQRFFVKEGYQSEEVARIEAKRGVEDLYLYYTWGKLEIVKLRDEMMQRWGAGYSLQRFHDALLAEGEIPLPLIGEALRAQ